MTRAFVNGKFYLVNGEFAEAVLVRGGVFAAVGTNAEIAALAAGADTIDLGGKTVLPGFNDSHCHLLNVAETLQSLVLTSARSVEDVVRLGKRFIAERAIPAGTPVVANGWNQDYFADEQRLLNRHDLDRISTEHPIVAIRTCGHVLGANTVALQAANVTKDSFVEGGEVRLGDDGEPNGIVTENAMKLLFALAAAMPPEQTAKILLEAMQYANSYGITSIQTNDLKDENWRDVYALYDALAKSGKSTVRVYHQCCFTDPAGLNDFIAAGMKTGIGDEMNKIGPLKLFVDGSLGARTALMRAPYADDPSTKGVECIPQNTLNAMVKTANDAGLQVATHAIGDGAIDMILTAYENVAAGGQNPMRNGIVHCQITDTGLLERFKNSDIFAYVQPIFLHYDMRIVESRVGKQLADTSYAFNTMDQLGLHVGYGTDSPVEDLNTLENLHCAVNRQDLEGNPAGGYNPGECVPLAKAIDNYTTGAAYASFEENRKGRILPGQLADLAVLDTDIFSVPADRIKDIKVAMTVLGGEVVFER